MFMWTKWNNHYQWSTAAEFDNLGFNVYREIGGKRELINRAPIAGLHCEPMQSGCDGRQLQLDG